jgi:hypothetical protein
MVGCLQQPLTAAPAASCSQSQLHLAQNTGTQTLQKLLSVRTAVVVVFIGTAPIDGVLLLLLLLLLPLL